jgi:hypothetical protein
MSNGIAIAAATRGLCAKLSEALAGSTLPMLGARVTSLRPTSLSATDAAVNVFMFQVTPNAAFRNNDLATRRGNGELVQRPQLALDLHFLLSFTGDEGELIPQRIMGIVLAALHAQPELQRDELVRLAQSNSPSYLDAADLAQQVELVRFSLGTMNLEELSKLWSVFFQTQYLLSITLQASVVLLEAPLSPSPAALVRERGIFSGTPRAPVIASVTPAFTALRSGGAAARIVLAGSDLLGASTFVRFGDGEPVPALSAEPGRVEVRLPPDTLAGVLSVRVLVSHPFERAGAAQAFRLESRPFPLALLPRILGPLQLAAPGRDFTVRVEPPVVRGQMVRLMLERRGADARRIALTWSAPATEPGVAIPRLFSTLRLSIPADLPAGEYRAQLEVDGVSSGLDSSFEELPALEVP